MIKREIIKPENPISSISHLRTQAERCLRLSRMCMDMVTARDLRLVSEEYFSAARQFEEAQRDGRRSDIADNSNQMPSQRSARG